MGERMTKEELAEIRRADKTRWRGQGEEVFRHRRELLAELDAVTRERDEAVNTYDTWLSEADVREKQAEQRGFERGVAQERRLRAEVVEDNERLRRKVDELSVDHESAARGGRIAALGEADTRLCRLMITVYGAEERTAQRVAIYDAIQVLRQLAKPPEQQLHRDQNLAEAMHSETDSGKLQPVGKP